MFRHLLGLAEGDNSEDHAGAILWNASAWIWTEQKIKEANYRNSLTLATEMNEEAMLADGFDDALIGADYGQNRAVYSIELMLQILMERDGMSLDEAREYFDFNIGAYVGEPTPLYVWTEDKFEMR